MLELPKVDNGCFHTKTAPIRLKAVQAQCKLNRMVWSLLFDTKMWLQSTMVDPVRMHGMDVWACEDRSKQVLDGGVFTTCTHSHLSCDFNQLV